jgi:predicted RNA-binding protein with PIN domain
MADQRLIIIDGYNLIHRSPLLRPEAGRTLRESREKLLNLLSWTVGTGDARFLVVFDGEAMSGREEHQGRIEVRYSRPPKKADDLIRELVEDQIDRVERLTVVTADLEVARHARAMGADVSISDLFLASILGPARESVEEKPTTLSKKEIEEWAALFERRKPGPAPPGNGEDTESP